MRIKPDRTRTVLVCLVALFFLVTTLAAGAETGFGGKWKGEIGGAGPANPGARGSQFAQGRGGFGGGAAGGGRGGAQKVTLNLKTKDKDTKAAGNITIGETTDDVMGGIIEGNRITFRAGKAPAPIYDYMGELNGDEITMMRAISGVKGATPVKFVLKRS